jgi:hypothetical protein
MESGFVASGDTPLVVLTVMFSVPAVVGVTVYQEQVMLLSRDPAGNVPASMLHMIVASPVAVSVSVYAVPTVPLGREAMVMVGGTTGAASVVMFSEGLDADA